MSLSSFFEEKFDERRTTTFCHHEDEEEEEEEEGAKNDDGISINRGKLRKNSRLGFSTKKKRSTQNFCLHLASSQQERTTKRALEGVRVCVCVCVDLESKQHIHTQKERNGAKLVVWRRRPRRE